MNSAIERLLSLKVSDVMTKRVFDVSLHQTMSEAARSLIEHDVSGAPVLDELGHCVGILSATDFMKWQTAPDVGGNLALSGQEHRLVKEEGEDEPLHIDVAEDDLVGAHMSPAVQTIEASATLLSAAREMCAEHVHRLPVVDERGHVQGVISSLDVVAALVNVFEE